MTGDGAFVKIRFTDERRFMFLGSGGRTTWRRVHASMFRDQGEAIRCADWMVANNENVAAALVSVNGHEIHRTGAATPPTRYAYGPENGFRYLVDVTRSGRAVFHVKDTEGKWELITAEVAEACYEERDRAGATGPIRVHATFSHYSTDNLVFVQESNR